MRHLINIAITTIITMLLITCSPNQQPINKKKRNFMQITINANDPLHKIANMFDNMEYTAFAPEQMYTYNFKITKSTISRIVFSLVKRKGYNTDFTIFVKINNQYYKCTGNNPQINIKPIETDSVAFTIISNTKPQRYEFVSDTLNNTIISISDHKYIHAIKRIDFYNNNILLNDSAQIVASNNNKDTHTLPSTFANNYINKLKGKLVDKIIYSNHNGFKATWLIRQNGNVAFYIQEKQYFEGKINSDNNNTFIDITNAIGIAPPSKVAIKIVNNNIVIPQMKIALPYDGNSLDFINLKLFPELFSFDIRYATENNFTKTVLYQEPFCYMRYAPAQDLIKIAQEFIEKGYKLKIFDGYRPHSCQFLMWKIIPNPNFLTDPQKGSIHNRGGAVDITLTTIDGKELNMGTDFDHCGYEAYTTNTNLPSEIISNRMLLKEMMEKHNFRGIRTEWWHFSHLTAYQYPLADITMKEFIEK